MAPGELVQREHGFERGDAAARDEHARALASVCVTHGHSSSGSMSIA